jgi:hypothetical protein
MKKVLFLTAIIFFFSSGLFAQDYKTAIGIRGGFPTGINFKTFTGNDKAIEVILSGYGGGFELTGLLEFHKQAFDTPNLNFYYGPGLHIGSFGNNAIIPGYYGNNRNTGFVLGIDGILGLEYTLTDIPFVIGVDVKPALDFISTPAFYVASGLSIRFYF